MCHMGVHTLDSMIYVLGFVWVSAWRESRGEVAESDDSSYPVSNDDDEREIRVDEAAQELIRRFYAQFNTNYEYLVILNHENFMPFF